MSRSKKLKTRQRRQKRAREKQEWKESRVCLSKPVLTVSRSYSLLAEYRGLPLHEWVREAFQLVAALAFVFCVVFRLALSGNVEMPPRDRQELHSFMLFCGILCAICICALQIFNILCRKLWKMS